MGFKLDRVEGVMVPHPSMWVTRSARAPGPEGPRVVALGGDGIGPEVVGAAVQCLRAIAPDLAVSQPLHGQAALDAGLAAFPPELREELSRADAVLFGSVDTEKGKSRPILQFLRWVRDAYANVRPAATLPGVAAKTGTGGTNLVIVRELSEGMYPGREGDLALLSAALPDYRDKLDRPLPTSGAFALRIITEKASRRVGAYAARLADHRKRMGVAPGRITIVTKQNVLPRTDGVFRAACEAAIAEVGGLEVDHLFVDEAARRLVAIPESFDVIVTTNLFGDVLSDVAAEIMGGLPMAPSAGVGEDWAYFESCHGSAPDLAGRGVANPTATILSAAMMLGYLGRDEAAQRLLTATLAAIRDGVRTRDLGGSAGTADFTAAVCGRL